MALTAAEQYAIELVNRGRLDPAGEARRHGIGLNDGLPYGGDFGAISTAPKQVLAINASLDRAATGHSSWMASTGTFSHTGLGGSSHTDRIFDAGYSPAGSWNLGENLAYANGGLAGGSVTEGLINLHHNTLMHSAAHRSNMLGGGPAYREISISEVTSGSRSYLTQNFAFDSTKVFVTGVAYADRNGNDFYSIGEGQGDVRFAIIGGNAARTAAAGGYAVQANASIGSVTVQIGSGDSASRVQLNLSNGNVKLDLVSNNLLKTSGNMTLLSGIDDAELLGVGNLNLTGSADANHLTGNVGRNTLRGGGGADLLLGMQGNDRLSGGSGNDVLKGGGGNDRLSGDAGNDRLFGGAGADSFVFGRNGDVDRVSDFVARQGDRLVIDDALWNGDLTATQVVNRFAEVTRQGVVFDFGGGDVLKVLGLTSTAGLAATIDIF